MADADRPARRHRYTCPCCGHLSFDDPPGSYDICPVCFWEDDLSQLRWPNMGGGANDASLIEAQQNFRQLGASEARFVEHVRPLKANNPIDPTWRLFDPSRDGIEPHASGIDYELTYAEDEMTYYYWVDEGRRRDDPADGGSRLHESEANTRQCRPLDD